MLFWTREEYEKFSEAIMDKPLAYYAFEMLYWCGLREGELLALTPSDFDFEKGTVSVSKTYTHLNRKDVITTPKTGKSNRTVQMPQNVCDKMRDYIQSLYKPEPDERIFPFTKYFLTSEMQRGSKDSLQQTSEQLSPAGRRARAEDIQSIRRIEIWRPAAYQKRNRHHALTAGRNARRLRGQRRDGFIIQFAFFVHQG